MSIYVGTAAWNLPKNAKEFFPEHGTHLEKYSQVLNAVEVNSSFYNDHKPETYVRWGQCVPEHFRFSVKLSKQFTHIQKLKVQGGELKNNLESLQNLGDRLGCLLVQLPPKLAFDIKDALHFFQVLRNYFEKPIAFEPRHVSWSQPEAQIMLDSFRISMIFADPEVAGLNPNFALRDQEIYYHRLHGSPDIYKTNYDDKRLVNYAEQMLSLDALEKTWCIFDNTTFGFATLNALSMNEIVNQQKQRDENLSSPSRGAEFRSL